MTTPTTMIAKLESRIMGGRQEKERSVFVGFIFGLIGLFPSIVVIILTGSVTMLSDLLKNVSLVLAVLLSWLAVKRAAKRDNPNYNYGFGKIENLSSLMVAAMMTVAIGIVLYETVERFRHPEMIKGIGVGIGVASAGISAIINAWMWRHDHRLAKKHSSPVMESMWRLYRVKTVSTLCVFFSLGLSLALVKYSWAIYIDPIGSIAMLGFLGFSAYSVVSSSVYDLLDKTLDESLQLVILRELASYFENYMAIHGIKSRRSGGHIYIEIFLGFDPEKKMGEVQKVIEDMKTGLEKKIPNSRVFIAPTISPVA